MADIARALDDDEAANGVDVPVRVDAASGRFVAPFIDPELQWDFRIQRVVSIQTSGHTYDLVYPGVGWVLWRSKEYLPEDLTFYANYLGAFKVKDEVDKFTVYGVSNKVREHGWLVPAYTFSNNREDLAVLRIVCRNGFGRDLAGTFLVDLTKATEYLQDLSGPLPTVHVAAGFSH